MKNFFFIHLYRVVNLYFSSVFNVEIVTYAYFSFVDIANTIFAIFNRYITHVFFEVLQDTANIILFILKGKEKEDRNDHVQRIREIFEIKNNIDHRICAISPTC